MLLPAIPLLLIWLALPLAALPFLRQSTLPTVTTALTLTAALLAALAVSLVPLLPEGLGRPMADGMMVAGPMMAGPGTLGMEAARGAYLIGLAFWLLAAGGLVLFAGGLSRGGNAGLFRALGGLGLVLLHAAAAIQVTRFFLPAMTTPGATDTGVAWELIAQADSAAAFGFLLGNALILALAVQALLSRLRRS